MGWGLDCGKIDKSEYVYYHENMKNQIPINFIKLMDRGMMVIPIRLRNELGLKKGDYITAVMKNDQIVLTPHIFPKQTSNTTKEPLKIRKSLISKEAGLKILSKKTKKPLWTKEDDIFLKQGRDLIEERLKQYDNT